jgi:solute:Na+ symporter, SSS family
MLNPTDIAIVVLYFIAMAWWSQSMAGSSKDKDTRSYLVGHNDIPWWAVTLSILGSEISGLTFVGVPALAYTGNWTYLQLTMGAIVARIIVGRYFVKAFYQHRVTSIYEFLSIRFGKKTRTAAATTFLVTRILMSGVRLYAGAVLAKLALGVSTPVAVCLLAALGFIYTIRGGITAVIWIEVVQVVVMFAGALATLWILFGNPSPDQANFHLEAQKLAVLDFRWDLTYEYTFWACLIGNTFSSVAIFGTDYDMVQRMLTAKNSSKSRLAVFISGLANIPISILFLAIGTGLYQFYQLHPDPNLPKAAKEIYPHFIFTQMPRGVAGLVTAAVLSVVLSSFQSALNSLAGSLVVDIYRPLRSNSSESNTKNELRILRISMGVCSLLLVLVALPCESVSEILKLGLEIGTYFYGGLLAVFSTGLFSRRGSDLSCIAGLLASICAVAVLKLTTAIAFPWFVLSGWIVGFVVCISGSPAPNPPIHALETALPGID